MVDGISRHTPTTHLYGLFVQYGVVEVSNVEIDVDDDVPVRTTCTYSSTRYTVAVGVRNNLLH